MQADFNRKVSRAIDHKRRDLAEAITDRHYELKPELTARYGEAGRAKYLEEAGYHLSYLSEAINASRPELFADYVAWAKVLLAGVGIRETDLADNLKVIQSSLQKHLPPDESFIACEYINFGLRQVADAPATIDSFIDIEGSEPLAELAQKYLEALLHGERHTASRLILEEAARGTGIKDLYLFVFQKTQREIGRLWQMNKLSVAQEHYCTAATQMIMSQLYPYLFTAEKNGRVMVATCVEGDFHEIGARMIADFFELDGWDTHYLGSNTPAAGILKMLAELNADLLVISATMTFHLRAVEQLIAAVRASEVSKNVKVMVGGYPFNIAPDLWKEIGADAYSSNADEAVAVANLLVGDSGS